MQSLIHPVWFIGMSAFIALIPVLLGLATSYVKVSVVLGIVRSALGTQNVPGTLVITALSIAVTGFIMSPVLNETMTAAATIDFAKIQRNPSLDRLIELSPIFNPWKRFLYEHSGEREVRALELLRHKPIDEKSRNSDNTEISILLPSFILTELRKAFSMACVVLLPFLVIDLVVANVLVGLGMFMVSPVMISLPLKLLLFVFSDAWILIVRGLIASYKV